MNWYKFFFFYRVRTVSGDSCEDHCVWPQLTIYGNDQGLTIFLYVHFRLQRQKSSRLSSLLTFPLPLLPSPKVQTLPGSDTSVVTLERVTHNKRCSKPGQANTLLLNIQRQTHTHTQSKPWSCSHDVPCRAGTGLIAVTQRQRNWGLFPDSLKIKASSSKNTHGEVLFFYCGCLNSCSEQFIWNIWQKKKTDRWCFGPFHSWRQHIFHHWNRNEPPASAKGW